MIPMTDQETKLRELLEKAKRPLPFCPYDRRSPEYWATPDDKPCTVCGGLPDGPDKCRGADTRAIDAVLAELPGLLDENARLRSEVERLLAEIEGLKPTPSPYEHMHSVVYRTGAPSAEDYDEAIEALQNARTALVSGDSMGCRVCEDSGHGANMCHHNPLLLARKWAAATRFWQCWHCGFVATNDAEGREHFGDHDGEPPSCIKAELIARAETAEAEVERLREAVKPFADAWNAEEFLAEAHWSDFRRASQALGGGR